MRRREGKDQSPVHLQGTVDSFKSLLRMRHNTDGYPMDRSVDAIVAAMIHRKLTNDEIGLILVEAAMYITNVDGGEPA